MLTYLSFYYNSNTNSCYQGRFQGGPEGPRPPMKFLAPLWPQKVQDKAVTCQNYITYPIVQHKSIGCVPPDESLATPEPPLVVIKYEHEHLFSSSDSEVCLRNSCKQ